MGKAQSDDAKSKKPDDKARTPKENVKHVVNTGLPPGIDVGQAKDPGSKAPDKPVENRS